MREGEKSKGETEKKSGKVIIRVQMDALEDVICKHVCFMYIHTHTCMCTVMMQNIISIVGYNPKF